MYKIFKCSSIHGLEALVNEFIEDKESNSVVISFIGGPNELMENNKVVFVQALSVMNKENIQIVSPS